MKFKADDKAGVEVKKQWTKIPHYGDEKKKAVFWSENWV